MQLSVATNIIFSLDVPICADAYADPQMSRVHKGLSGTEIVEDVVG
jgi:hypothetical protein